jgi:hypothetical protein
LLLGYSCHEITDLKKLSMGYTLGEFQNTVPYIDGGKESDIGAEYERQTFFILIYTQIISELFKLTYY